MSNINWDYLAIKGAAINVKSIKEYGKHTGKIGMTQQELKCPVYNIEAPYDATKGFACMLTVNRSP